MVIILINKWRHNNIISVINQKVKIKIILQIGKYLFTNKNNNIHKHRRCLKKEKDNKVHKIICRQSGKVSYRANDNKKQIEKKKDIMHHKTTKPYFISYVFIYTFMSFVA